MATVVFNKGLNFDNVDFNWYQRNIAASSFENDTNSTYMTEMHEDIYTIHGQTSDSSWVLAAAGEDFATNAKGQLIDGTVRAFGEKFYLGGDIWSAFGVNISAKALFDVGQTASNVDDKALLADAFSGDDFFYLSADDDTAYGFGGNDLMESYAGNDTLYGCAGNDTLTGGAGNDRLIGGAGRDTLSGQWDVDTFVFTAVSDSAVGRNRDVITDFEHEVDLIDLGGIDANTRRMGDQAFRFIGDHAFTGRAGELQFVNQILSGDVNGDGIADFQVKVTGQTHLHAEGFIL